jgi:hypothetical protein
MQRSHIPAGAYRPALAYSPEIMRLLSAVRQTKGAGPVTRRSRNRSDKPSLANSMRRFAPFSWNFPDGIENLGRVKNACLSDIPSDA